MKSKGRKILLIVIIAVVVAAAIGAGCFFLFGNRNSEPVNVYEFMYLGMTEYWGDSKESYGPVSTDNIQTVFLSSTQTVTEVLVQMGDSVKKGDLLMTFDTTLTDIALERERLKVEKLKLDLEDAQEELQKINGMKPMVVPSPDDTEEPEETPGIPLSGPYQISSNRKYDGSTQDLALICWISADTAIDGTVLNALLAAATEYQNTASEPEPTDPPETTPEETIPEETDPTDPSEETTLPTQPEEPPATPDHFYVVFKITEGNLSTGQTLMWQGMYVTWDTITLQYRFHFFDASTFPDHTQPVPEAPDANQPDTDFGSGFTAAEIAKMRSQQEKAIRDLQFQIKMAEADYKIMQAEVADGNVYAEIDGTVVSLLTPEEAQMTQQPLMKISSGGGFYVEGSISELDKDNLQIGQEVTVNDWNTGMVYTGSVVRVEDVPLSSDYFYGNGNPNVSYYPFTVYIDGSADLRAGDYVSVMYSTSTAESGIYLENPFLRTENGMSYVYVQGEDGLLEKRFVTTGKSLWGSYTEILEGLTPEDLIAFPYGKNVKAGAETVESDISALYEY